MNALSPLIDGLMSNPRGVNGTLRETVFPHCKTRKRYAWYAEPRVPPTSRARKGELEGTATALGLLSAQCSAPMIGHRVKLTIFLSVPRGHRM